METAHTCPHIHHVRGLIEVNVQKIRAYFADEYEY